MRLRSLFLAIPASAALLVLGCARDDAAPDRLEIVTGVFPAAYVGLPYSFTPVVRNAVPPVTWTLVSGSLPAGLGLDPTSGEVSGTPTTLETASFALRVSDGTASSVDGTFSIPVGPPPLTITTDRLPPAQVGVAYNVPLQHMGGSGAPTWTLASGSLPVGLLLNPGSGVIQGVPAVGAAPQSFEVVLAEGTEQDIVRFGIELDPAAMTRVVVKQDGSGHFTTVTAALNAVPMPVTQTHVIEIADDGVYAENLVVSFVPQTGTEWLSIRSAFDRLPTLQAALAGVDALRISSGNVEIRGLHIDGAGSANGIRVDTLASPVLVVNCLLTGNRTAFDATGASPVYFVNNTCSGERGIALNGAGAVARNNVIHATGSWAIESLGCAADYNLYWAPGGAVGSDGTATYPTLAAWQGAAISGDANSLQGDPLFANPTGGDFGLDAGSPAEDAAEPLYWAVPVTDARGYGRKTGAGVEMGAFERR